MSGAADKVLWGGSVKGDAQHDAVLGALRAANGGWVGLPELREVAGCATLCPVITRLRKKYAVRIENRLGHLADGTRTSWYRLVE